MTLTLVLVLAPAILINVLLWHEHFSGVAFYDPAVGGNPTWQFRPLLTPVLAAAAGIVRLALSHVWPVAPRYRRILLGLAVVALLTAVASQIPEPHFSYAPQ